MKSNTHDKAEEPKLQAGTSPRSWFCSSSSSIMKDEDGTRPFLWYQPLFHGQGTLKPHLSLQSIWKGKSPFHVLHMSPSFLPACIRAQCTLSWSRLLPPAPGCLHPSSPSPPQHVLSPFMEFTPKQTLPTGCTSPSKNDQPVTKTTTPLCTFRVVTVVAGMQLPDK